MFGKLNDIAMEQIDELIESHLEKDYCCHIRARIQEKIAKHLGDIVNCECCGCRILKSKAVEGKSVVRVRAIRYPKYASIKSDSPLTEKYIRTPFYCGRCAPKGEWANSFKKCKLEDLLKIADDDAFQVLNGFYKDFEPTSKETAKKSPEKDEEARGQKPKVESVVKCSGWMKSTGLDDYPECPECGESGMHDSGFTFKCHQCGCSFTLVVHEEKEKTAPKAGKDKKKDDVISRLNSILVEWSKHPLRIPIGELAVKIAKELKLI